MEAHVLFLLSYNFLLVCATPMHQGPNSAYTSTDPRDLRRTNQVRLASLSCSCVSVVASIVAFYWFCRMTKRFRHRLIMILIYGDLMRGVWYFIFAAYSVARGRVKTQTIFCQASGFFIQYGAETSDYGVLVIAVHSALQVFRPANRGRSDVLHHYRHSVFAGALMLPVLMASLAFVNPGYGYLSQGAFCTLPIRPFWYLLALAWIPRYLIVLTIFGLAIAIYTYVGFEFRSYANANQDFETPITSMNSDVSYPEKNTDTKTANRPALEHGPGQGRRASSIAHDILLCQRGGSDIAFANDRTSPNRITVGEAVFMQSLPETSLDNHVDGSLAFRRPLFAIPSGSTIKQSTSSPNPTGPHSPISHQDSNATAAASRISSVDDQESPSSCEPSPMSPAQHQLFHQRQRVHRQLRLMFIYPMVYTLMWVIPFVNHCMQYNDYFAARPVIFVRLGSAVCICSMGFVDCLIFSIREKPWRNIKTSDGTIWGSFAVWRKSESFGTGSITLMEEGQRGGMTVDTNTKESGGATTFAKIRSSVRTSASDDYTRIAAEQAKIRLDMEREERLAEFQMKSKERRGSESLDEEDTSLHEPDGNSDFEKGDGIRSTGLPQTKGKEKATGSRRGYLDL